MLKLFTFDELCLSMLDFTGSGLERMNDSRITGDARSETNVSESETKLPDHGLRGPTLTKNLGRFQI